MTAKPLLSVLAVVGGATVATVLAIAGSATPATAPQPERGEFIKEACLSVARPLPFLRTGTRPGGSTARSPMPEFASPRKLRAP